jgi:predicted secreted protein
MKSYPDPENLIENIVGEEFTISFESIPSAGFLWNVEYDLKIIKLESNEYVSHSSFDSGSSNIKIAGGVGCEIFKFRGIQPGETLIKAKYQRIRGNPLDIKIFKVNIRK